MMDVDKTLIGGEVLASAEDKEKNFGTECSIKLNSCSWIINTTTSIYIYYNYVEHLLD